MLSCPEDKSESRSSGAPSERCVHKPDEPSKRTTIFKRSREPLPSSTTDHRSCSRFFFNKDHNPPPPKASIHDEVLTPEASACVFSRLWFLWLNPLLSLGYSRPLEVSDLYKLQDDRSCTRIAKAILTSFERRQKDAAIYNERLANGDVSPGLKGLWWSLRGVRAEREKAWRDKDGKRKASLILAMNDSVKWLFWSAGILKVIGDTADIISPLIVKLIITFATESHAASKPTPPVGTGIGLCFVLLILRLVSSWCTQHFFYRSMACGVLLRGGLITAIYSRALSLSPRARIEMTNGRLVNHISTDVSRIDFCMGYFHMSWTTPVQLSICLILLLINLGPSGLTGFALLIVGVLANTMATRRFFRMRVKSMIWTDKRSKLMQQILSGMRVIKFFGWETPFLKRIAEYRQLEMGYIRKLLVLRAGLHSLGLSLPLLASVLTFVTYSLAGHPLSAADAFSSLTLFQLVRSSLLFLPISLGSIADAFAACGRLYEVFETEISDRTLSINKHLDVAVRVDGADFTWESPSRQSGDLNTTHDRLGVHGRGSGKSKIMTTPTLQPVDELNIFKLQDINMEIPRGRLVAIVGAVGAGKTSLLQGIIGEMKRVAGTVEFGGSVAYCAQTAWIQNATIRENICFGRPFEEERYWKAVHDSCLEPDLRMLPSYDLTEVGEKGISLSGGQKQRINICRAIYRDSDIIIFDDPLSALDAHVGKAVFSNVLKDATNGKTRILVTHTMHFLSKVDYIYTLVDGRIAERGTFNVLMARGGLFYKFVEEFGSKEDNRDENAVDETELVSDTKREESSTKGKTIMREEERNTGAIPPKVYQQYLSAGNGTVLVPIMLLSIAILQGCNIMSSYWLVYWEEPKGDYTQSFYMGIYAALGVTQSVAYLFVGSAFVMLTYYASQELHERAIVRVLHAPMSFFETTPLGHIMHRFAKDIDTLDNSISDSLRTLSTTASNVFGAIIIISVVLPWFLLVTFFGMTYYLFVAVFYRASARELKRLDALLRGSLYAHFSESLSGLTTITAYGETERFKRENIELVDIENRAYWLTVANQRWLGFRVDFLGALLIFVVSFLTVGTRFNISPGQTGLVLSYMIRVQQSLGMMLRQLAEVENNMNSVERIVHYANEVEQEAPHRIRENTAPACWPTEGRIVMKNVFMKYRPGLPPILKGLCMTIAPAEKIGIVGRTGAGKSSIMTVLYRLVELSSGSIQIDGVDISTVGLEQLRKGLAIIPQDAFLFAGTMRSNLDPFGLYDDACLWDALKRAHLVDVSETDESLPLSPLTTTKSDQVVNRRFDLDTPTDHEGSNLSVGQRSLVSLARALVHETQILILDEATASVDYETDRKIQDTIATEFKERTILCIAHRLRTILSYDRICVLDAGIIAEFDTPTNLFNIPDGIFRGMCDRSSISLEDVRSASQR